MKDSQFDKIQGWFGTLNDNMERMQGDIEYLKSEVKDIKEDMQTGFDAIHSDMAMLKSSVRRIDARMAFIEGNTHSLQESDHDQQNAIRDFHVRLERIEEHISS